MSEQAPDQAKLRDLIAREAMALGFAGFGIAPAEGSAEMAERLTRFVALERHGSMDWMAQTQERRSNPQAMWPEANSVIMLAFDYGPDVDALENLSKPDIANISVYARNRDYHDVIKGRLKTLAGKIAVATGGDVKVFVDTAPLMEKPMAALAGIGWQGKHTNLVSRKLGSWFFLGAILTEANLGLDQPEVDHCGSCRACLDICPTDAFPAPYQLDARRCISYLTIEHKGMIALEFRKAMGNRIYGCDDCLAVCPWNKFAQAATELKLVARQDLIAPSIRDFLQLDDKAFRSTFSGSPIKRIGRNRFVRNVLIAAGNSGCADVVGSVKALLGDADPVVRATAIWALGELMGKEQALHHIPAQQGDALAMEEIERLKA